MTSFSHKPWPASLPRSHIHSEGVPHSLELGDNCWCLPVSLQSFSVKHPQDVQQADPDLGLPGASVQSIEDLQPCSGFEKTIHWQEHGNSRYES